MKKTIQSLALIAILIINALPAPAADITKTIEVLWQQPAADLPFVKQYNLFVGTSKESVARVAEIQYVQGAPLTAVYDVVLPGTYGQTTNLYAALSAVSKGDVETARVFGKTEDGNEYIEIIVPWPEVSPPMNVIMRVKIDAAPRGTNAKSASVLDAIKGTNKPK